MSRWRCKFDEGQQPPYPFPCKAEGGCGGSFCWRAHGFTSEPPDETDPPKPKPPPDFLGKADVETKLAMLDAMMLEKTYEQFELILKMMEHIISTGAPITEAFAAARQAIMVMTKAIHDELERGSR